MAERGGQRRWTQDPPGSGEDPSAEGDPTGAAHRPCRSVTGSFCFSWHVVLRGRRLTVCSFQMKTKTTKELIWTLRPSCLRTMKMNLGNQKKMWGFPLFHHEVSELIYFLKVQQDQLRFASFVFLKKTPVWPEKSTTPKPQEEEQAEESPGEEGAGGAGADGGRGEREGEGEEGSRGRDRVRHGGAGDLWPQLHLLQKDLWGFQGKHLFKPPLGWPSVCLKSGVLRCTQQNWRNSAPLTNQTWRVGSVSC